MSITTPTPEQRVDTFRDRINRVFAEVESWPYEIMDRIPIPVDIEETDDQIIVTASMSGYTTDEIDVDVRDGSLHIQGTTEDERETRDAIWHRRERRIGTVKRTVLLPAAVDHEQAEATLRDGVLRVALTKREPTPARKIKVQPD
jgi:HSP20 family protein